MGGIKNLGDFAAKSLLETPPYHLDESSASIKLDQNEFPEDIPQRLKMGILDHLNLTPWNRYPKPFTPSLNEILAAELGVSSDNILTAPGSDHLITLIYQALLPKTTGGSTHVLTPSFPLYSTYLRAINRPFREWNLNSEDLSFDLSYSQNFKAGDLVCLATPNNPSSTSISYSDMELLLKNYQETLFVVDEAYFEFAERDFVPLAHRYPNIILLRTFSKTAALAGMRFGYLIAHATIVAQLIKLRLPYMLNQFTIAGVEYLLKNKEFATWKNEQLQLVTSERNRTVQLYKKECLSTPCQVVGGVANFFVLRWQSQEHCDGLYRHWIESSIQVRNVSKAPLMAASLRVSIGKTIENNLAFESFQKFIRSKA